MAKSSKPADSATPVATGEAAPADTNALPVLEAARIAPPETAMPSTGESDLADTKAQLETARLLLAESQMYAKEIEGRLAESRMETEKARQALLAAQTPPVVIPAKVW